MFHRPNRDGTCVCSYIALSILDISEKRLFGMVVEQSSYLHAKFARTSNSEHIKPFIVASANLRKGLVGILWEQTELPITDLDKHACTLSFAVIACNWLPIARDIQTHAKFFKALKLWFPKRRKGTYYTHRLFETLASTLSFLKKHDLELEVWKIVEVFFTQQFDLKEEYFGRAYEDIRKAMPKVSGSKLKFVQNPARKEHGKYYTPEDITEFMVKRSVDSWMQGQSLESLTDLTAPKIFDPTVGAGAFLLATVRYLETQWESFVESSPVNKLRVRQQIIEHCVYGLDLDGEALLVCQFSLWLLGVGEEQYQPNLDSNFRNENVLIIQKEWKRYFDIVVGNPPYVSLSKKSEAYILAARLGAWTLECRNLYAYTIEAALIYLRARGILCLIVPLGITVGSKLSSMRLLLKEQLSFVECLNFSVVPGYLFNQGRLEDTAKAITQRCTIVTVNRSIRKNWTGQQEFWSSKRLRWNDGTERQRLFTNEVLQTQRIPEDFDFVRFGIPNMGTQQSYDIFDRIRKRGTPLEKLLSKKPVEGVTTLTVFKSYRYFIHANRSTIDREGITLYPKDKHAERLLYIYLNSNLFYWYARLLGGEQGLSADFVLSVFVPLLDPQSCLFVYEKLVSAEQRCLTQKNNAGKVVRNINFNKQMSLLIEIDCSWMESLDLPLEYGDELIYSKSPQLDIRPMKEEHTPMVIRKRFKERLPMREPTVGCFVYIDGRKGQVLRIQKSRNVTSWSITVDIFGYRSKHRLRLEDWDGTQWVIVSK